MASLLSAATLLQTQAPSQPLTQAAVHGRSRAELKKAAKDFETSMISQMLKPMFDGLSTAPPFGGGEAEGSFRSFLVDAMAKQVSKSGGLKLSPAIEAELVKMQGGAA